MLISFSFFKQKNALGKIVSLLYKLCNTHSLQLLFWVIINNYNYAYHCISPLYYNILTTTNTIYNAFCRLGMYSVLILLFLHYNFRLIYTKS